MTTPYNINDYQNPLFTVDSVLFTIKNNALNVLLVKRANQPFIDHWGLPGGFVDINKDTSTDQTALRKLKEKTNVSPFYLEQLESYSGHERDPRGFSVTLVYFALVPEQAVSTHIETVDDVKWIEVNSLNTLSIAFDHAYIIQQAKTRLQQKALYSMTPVYCLPPCFTIGQFKQVIEAIIEKTIQRKTLIRRIEASDMFETIDKKVKSGGRLAQVYKIKPGVDIVNFERNLSI